MTALRFSCSNPNQPHAQRPDPVHTTWDRYGPAKAGPWAVGHSGLVGHQDSFYVTQVEVDAGGWTRNKMETCLNYAADFTENSCFPGAMEGED